MQGELEPQPAELQRLLLPHVCPTHLYSTVGQAVGLQGCWAGVRQWGSHWGCLLVQLIPAR